MIKQYKPTKPVVISKEKMKKLAEEGLAFRREIEKRADKMTRLPGIITGR